MLMNRIIGAFTFKKEVYAEVEKDASFTVTAWGLVAAVALISGLVSYMTTDVGILGLVLGTVLGVAAFAIGAFVIAWVGKAMFKADVSFDEMVRTLGLAQVWGLLGILAFVPFLSVITCVTGILSLVSYFLAAKEALDLEWAQTIVTVVIGYIAILAVTVFVGGAIGLGAVGVGALMGGQ